MRSEEEIRAKLAMYREMLAAIDMEGSAFWTRIGNRLTGRIAALEWILEIRNR